MTPEERVDTLERKVNRLEADMANLAAQLVRVKADVDRKTPPIATRPGVGPVVG